MTRSAKRPDVLPTSLPPRGLSRIAASAYLGIGTTLFDRMVRDGRMPSPKRINGRVIWDRLKLDAAFDALPDDGNRDEDLWDSCAV